MIGHNKLSGHFNALCFLVLTALSKISANQWLLFIDSVCWL